MVEKYNIYCDESCWMQFDDTHVIAWGAVWCPSKKAPEIHKDLRAIRSRFNLPEKFEVKWSKVSNGKVDFYNELITYFFSNSDLSYRGLIVPDKSIIDHDIFHQTHNEWYYKMYFDLIKVIINPRNLPNACFDIYFDRKDNWQANRLRYLHTVFNNYLGDSQKKITNKLQIVDSKEVGLIQISDLITGAITYTNRGLLTNDAKLSVIANIKNLSNLSLTNSTSQSRKKFNLLVWRPK